jgi:hypothetical protein
MRTVKNFLPLAKNAYRKHLEAARPPQHLTRTLRIKKLSVHSLCSANGHNVDPVDVFRLMLQTRLDAACQCLNLGTAQAVVDVDPGHNPYTAQTDEGEEEFANGGHTWLLKEKARTLLISWPEWLGEASSIAAPRPPGGSHPGAGSPGILEGYSALIDARTKFPPVLNATDAPADLTPLPAGFSHQAPAPISAQR